MKLVRFGPKGEERPGILVADDQLIDVSSIVSDFDQDFFAAGGLDFLQSHLSELALETLHLSTHRLGPPVPKPYQILCVGLNYIDHISELGMPVPEEPLIFTKGPRSLSGPYDDIPLPPRSETTDWEIEVAVVIGKEARYLKDEAAAERCIAGYTISNDLSERHYQFERGGQWVKGKSFESFNPLGPYLVTTDELGSTPTLSLSLSVNGTVRQRSDTSRMLFSPPFLVWYLSQFTVLEPGDIVNTGTPAGVGMGQDPPTYLRPGDVLKLAVDRLGHQRYRVI